jgi:hypothetical protein
MATGQRRFVLAVGLAAAAALGTTIYIEWKPLRLEWWHWRAAREIREAMIDPAYSLPPALQTILDAGEAGYPALACLLRDPDQGEWKTWWIKRP